MSLTIVATCHNYRQDASEALLNSWPRHNSQTRPRHTLDMIDKQVIFVQLLFLLGSGAFLNCLFLPGHGLVCACATPTKPSASVSVVTWHGEGASVDYLALLYHTPRSLQDAAMACGELQGREKIV